MLSPRHMHPMVQHVPLVSALLEGIFHYRLILNDNTSSVNEPSVCLYAAIVRDDRRVSSTRKEEVDEELKNES